MRIMNTENPYVITIGRRFGSGGRELGKVLAERFGIEYYDRELLFEAAKQAGIAPEFFVNADERAPTFLSGLFSFNMGNSAPTLYSGSNSISDDKLYGVTSDVILHLARTRSCVIVGRTADYILREHPRAVHIFVDASDKNEVAARIMSRKDCTSVESALKKAAKVNKLRANFYNFYTDKIWGDSSSYNFTFDSSLLPADKAVDVIAEYIRARFGFDPRR